MIEIAAEHSRPAHRPDRIFVQIASYRDPELLPTLLDLVRRAARPDNLRIVVCWQHGSDETLGMFFRHAFSRWHSHQDPSFERHTFSFLGARIELLDVPYQASEGVCWARHQIQRYYENERYTLQLDSHHRFVDDWDAHLVQMLESLRTRSPHPLLTAYLPAYTPDAPHPADTEVEATPSRMVCSGFSADGIPLFRAAPMAPDTPMHRPVTACFYSGHFAFADGTLVQEVPHDPEGFFHGEEISLAARAYTHGYDLYHPTRVLAWHEYTREGRRKFWDDHNLAAHRAGHVPLGWWMRNATALERCRMLLGCTDNAAPADVLALQQGPFGFGHTRTLDDYAHIAGLNFGSRQVRMPE